MSKVSRIGVIVEDMTDYYAIRTLIERIANTEGIGFKPKNANGCAKIRSKCGAWSVDLRRRGCDMLIVVHDLDDRNYQFLKKEIDAKLTTNPITNYYVCIPVEEMEAWFLADGNAIKKALGLRRVPKIKGHPETIQSPKEVLRDQIMNCSNNEIEFSTSQNQLIAQHVDIDTLLDRCPSFRDFHAYLTSHSYT